MKKNINFFNKIIFLESVDSTNDYLKKNDFKDRTIIYTYNQTKGRGRDQKKWIDFKDQNLAISFLIKPDIIVNNNIWYIAASSLALIDIIKKMKISGYWIKWPNDIYIEKSKIAGILAESIWQSNRINKLIIGIGINVNCTSSDLSVLKNDATSFYILSGTKPDLKDFFNKYNKELSKWLTVLLCKKNGMIKVKKNWLKYCKILNKEVEWRTRDIKKSGRIVKIEDDGTIILRTEEKDEKVISGEIILHS